MKSTRSIFKTCVLTITATVALIAVADSARAALLAYEPFDNPVGTAIIGSSSPGSFGWGTAWVDYRAAAGTTATNLGYSLGYSDGVNSLVTLGGAGFFQGRTTAAGDLQPMRLLPTVRGTNDINEVSWISFLSLRQGPTTTLANPYGRGANLAHDLTNYASTSLIQRLAVGGSSGAPSNTVNLIPLGSGGARKPTDVTFGGQLDFIVMAIEHNSGNISNDTAYVWVNPTDGAGLPLGGANPAFSTALTNTLGVAYEFQFDRIRVFAGGNANASQPYVEWIVDEYRLGESWADVTPIPEPTVAVLGGLAALALVLYRRKR